MRFTRWAAVLAVAALVSALTWAPATAGSRQPIATKGLWRGGMGGVAVDARGDVYVTGAEGRNERMVVRRYARGGGLIWERTFRVPGDRNWTRGKDVAVGPDGTVYVAGIKTVPSGDREFRDVGTFLRAYGPGGHLRWQRIHWVRKYQDEIATGVAAGPGFVVVTGYTSCFECVGHEGWVRVWNTGGRLLWVDDFEFVGIATEKRDRVDDVAVDRDGSIYIVGVVDRLEDEYGGDAPADSEVVIRRMTPSGGIVWTRVLSDRSKDSDLGRSIAVHGGRVAVGAIFGADTTQPHPWVRALTASGRSLWTRSWSGGHWYEDVGVALDATDRVTVAWSGGHGVHLKALSARGWGRWSSGVDARGGPVDLAAADGLLRVGLNGPTCCHAKLYTYRA